MKIEEAILYVLAERNGGLRTESSNHDRMFICFVALILAKWPEWPTSRSKPGPSLPQKRISGKK